MPKRLTNLEFIRRAKARHGNKYDYSESIYVNAKTKIRIICPVHGLFQIRPDNHINLGQGCKQCGYHISAKSKVNAASKKFFDEAPIIHNYFYDYSAFDYVDSATEGLIVCPIHGEFSQLPGVHLNGCGCPECGRIKNGDAKRKERDEFVKQARCIHGNKYNYDLVEYINTHKNVLIGCNVPRHKPFLQWPSNHLSGSGCPKCGDAKGAVKRSLNIEEFRARMDCIDTIRCLNPENYINHKSVLKFFCLVHDQEHFATVNNVLNGQGLHCCGHVGGDSIARFFEDDGWANRNCFFYVASVVNRYHKPGITEDLKMRLRTSKGLYDQYLFTSPMIMRNEAWTIELRILKDSSDLMPSKLDDIPDGWGGVSELRTKSGYSILWYINRFYFYLDQVNEYGWLDVANFKTPCA